MGIGTSMKKYHGRRIVRRNTVRKQVLKRCDQLCEVDSNKLNTNQTNIETSAIRVGVPREAWGLHLWAACGEVVW